MLSPTYPKATKFQGLNSQWNLISITEGYIFSHSPFMATAVCYFPPLYLKGRDILAEQQQRFVRGLFSLPTNSIVSSYLLKYPRDAEIDSVCKSPHEVLNFLEEKRTENFNSFPTFEYQPYISISVPVDFKQGFSLKAFLTSEKLDISSPGLRRAFKSATEQIDNIIGQLKATFGGNCVRLSSQGIAQFLGVVLNHTTRNNTSDLSSIISSDVFSSNKLGTSYYGGYFHGCLSIRHDGFPDTADPDLWGILYDETIKHIPFTVKLTTTFPDSVDAKKKANAMVSRIDAYNSLFGAMVKDLMVQKEKLDAALYDLEHENGRLVDVALVLETWADNEDDLELNLKTLANVLRAKEVSLKRDTYNHKATWHSIMPFCGQKNRLVTRIPSMHVEPLLPLLFPPYYPNFKAPTVPTYIHSSHDVLMSFDLMDHRDPSWNGMIAGGSGTGKSFLANYLISNHLKSGGKLFIIDKGGQGAGSYRNLVLNIPTGRYIELRLVGDMGFTINFFDGPLFVRAGIDSSIEPDIEGEVDGDKENFLTKVITLMVMDHGERISKQDESRLSRLIRAAYKAHNNNSEGTLSLDVFCRDFMAAEFPELVEAIHKFIGDGIYAKFFKSTTRLENVDCFCFDLEGIDSHPDLAPILTLVITSFAYSLCQKEKGVRKMLVVDEAWSAFNGPLAGVIENMWRTIRKHNGFIYCVTQSFEDVLKSDVADALMNNSTHYFICGANHQLSALERLSASGEQTNKITEYDYDRIRNLQFKKGEYAEYYMMCPNYKGAIRLRPSAYDYWFSTTNADDKQKMESIKAKMGVSYVSKDVLEAVVNSR